jgi:anti-sigma regulatory factor (Ser/Thr protein kinase)
VLAELFTNALEHGLLGLDSSAKETEQGFSDYYQMRDQQLQNLQQGSIILGLDYRGDKRSGRLEVMVEDTGMGFDFAPIMQARKQLNEYSGRGIQLIEGLCDSVEYTGNGNRVKVLFSWSDGKRY